jgi:formamidopyrimidine-DNA glycosylase
MPELPEVEEVRRSLEPQILEKRIQAARVFRPDFVAGDPTLSTLVGRRFTRTHRHGKRLFLITGDDGPTLLVHLGMTGRVDCVPPDAPILPHTHVVLTLDSPLQVRFCDPRRFGGLWYYPDLSTALAHEARNLGPDALQLAPADLRHWRTTHGRLKQRLLSQRDVAGLGNIYVDEALWHVRLHPLQRVGRLNVAQIAGLVAAIRSVLNRSLRMGGTTLRDYRNARNQPGRFVRMLQAYGRGGQPCRRCGTTLRTAVIATRTTVFCPNCQHRR